MSETTVLDAAHDAMQTEAESCAGDGAARLQFYEQLADTELFVLLSEEASGEAISPELFEVAEGQFVLTFDSEERLAQFADRAVPYAAVSGRVLAQMLSGQGIGLGVNLEVAPSSILIPAEAVAWLNQTLDHMPEQVETHITGFAAPSGLPEALITALAAKLSTAVGLAQAAYLVAVQYQGGGHGHLLGFVGASERAQAALAKAAGEALTFTGIEAGEIDVGFFDPIDPVAEKLRAVGLVFELPQPEIRDVVLPSEYKRMHDETTKRVVDGPICN
jgi:hypothetical protein